MKRKDPIRSKFKLDPTRRKDPIKSKFKLDSTKNKRKPPKKLPSGKGRLLSRWAIKRY